MGFIVGIGGGSIESTLKIDKYCIELTAVSCPNILFIPTASNDDKEYCDKIEKHFNDNFGCSVKHLLLCKASYTSKEIDDMLNWANIIYIGGGNTVFMLNKWKEIGLGEKLKDKYYNSNIILEGISAGAICWAKYGYSDSASFTNKDEHWHYGFVDGINISGFEYVCPHYTGIRQECFDEDIKIEGEKLNKNISGLGLDNDTAFVISSENSSIVFITATKDVFAYSVEYKNKMFFKEKKSINIL